MKYVTTVKNIPILITHSVWPFVVYVVGVHRNGVYLFAERHTNLSKQFVTVSVVMSVCDGGKCTSTNR